MKKNTKHNFSYPSSAAAVVFGVYLSARAAFRLDRKSPAIHFIKYELNTNQIFTGFSVVSTKEI